MNVVMLAGGTGPIALQTGLFEFEKKVDGLKTTVLVNAYDNGLSTGAVRRVADGKILGPSDVRKNHFTRFKLQHPDSFWIPFFEIRFTSETSNARQYALNELDAIHEHIRGEQVDGVSKYTLLKEAIETYFACPLSNTVDYIDFSLANIIYGGFAIANKNSLRTAATIVSKIIGVEDNVILNDDRSLFISAVSASGKKINDEVDIDEWNNLEDPVVDLFFTDETGEETLPMLDDEAATALKQADAIILSAGTQWTSLIPIYYSVGFKQAIAESKAPIVMVMNRVPDTDCPSQTADDLVNFLTDRFFPADRFSVVIDSTGHPQMSTLSEETRAKIDGRVVEFDGHVEGKAGVHDPQALFKAVANAIFFDMKANFYMFDYDDTLVGRNGRELKSSKLNLDVLAQLSKNANVGVCSGNSIKSLHFSPETHFDKLSVYTDGGAILNNLATGDHFQIDPKVTLSDELIDHITKILIDVKIPKYKIKNKNDVIVSMRPIEQEYRSTIAALLRIALKNELKQYDLVVSEIGRTTIEINHRELSKRRALELSVEAHKSVIYVGDEFYEGGNDLVAFNIPGVKCLHANSPTHVALFMETLHD